MQSGFDTGDCFNSIRPSSFSLAFDPGPTADFRRCLVSLVSMGLSRKLSEMRSKILGLLSSCGSLTSFLNPFLSLLRVLYVVYVNMPGLPSVFFKAD